MIEKRLFAWIVSIAVAAASLGADTERTLSLQPVVTSLPSVGGTWTTQGPTRMTNGMVEGITDGPVIGAINTIVPHPTNANIVWIGSVNGGIWKTTNATNPNPTWTPQTDTALSLSISDLQRDPTDATHQTLVAATASVSSMAASGPQGAILRTINGGTSWSVLTPSALAGLKISGIAARGQTIVVTIGWMQPRHCHPIYRSTDGGQSFSLVHDGGYAWDLAGDPGNTQILYAAITQCGIGTGIYKSTDTGATWNKVSDSLVDDRLRIAGNAKISVGAAGQIYVVMIQGDGKTPWIYRSEDSVTWTPLDQPGTTENGTVHWMHPGAEGRRFLSLAADPSNSNIVYAGGDKQPGTEHGVSVPNSIGAMDYTGRLFRVNASFSSGSQSTPLTHSFTMNNSAPHADSRAIAFDAAGNLLEGDDGGIYRRTNPQGAGAWFSMNGNLQVTEMHNVAYDSLSNMIMGGSQDNGTSEQSVVGGLTWRQVFDWDGGDVAVDDTSSTTQSLRYGSHQWLGAFFRRTMDSSGTEIEWVSPGLIGMLENIGQFRTPIDLNRIDPTRILFACRDGLYESLDRGHTVTALGGPTFATAMVYGGSANGASNVDLIYAIAGNKVFLRASGSGAPGALQAQPTTDDLRDIAVDATDWHNAYVVTQSGSVFSTANAGASWTNITGTGPTGLANGSTDLRTILHITGNPSLIVVGGLNGVFRMATNDDGHVWNQLGTGLTNALLFDLDYDPADDVLVAGTVGRGVWSLTPVGGGPPVAPPTNVVATATSTTNVNVTWTAAAGASTYRVYRRSSGGLYTLVGQTASTSFNDGTAAASTAYLYKVRSVAGSESGDSNMDLAATVMFTDPSLIVGTTLVRAVHFNELRTAVNAVRTLAGFAPIAFTPPAPGSNIPVIAAHMTDLRNGLNPARSALGLPAQGFTDPTVTPGITLVKAIHINEARNGVQ